MHGSGWYRLVVRLDPPRSPISFHHRLVATTRDSLVDRAKFAK